MQSSNVRYVYPVQTSMAQGQPSVAMDNQTYTQNAPYPSPMATNFPNFQGNTVQTVETVNQTSYPVQGVSSEAFQTYPVQYPSQSSCNYGQMQSTMYYNSVPTSSPQMGLIYNGNQGQFQSQVQPSQTSNPAMAMQGSATTMLNIGQPVAVGNVQAPNTHNFIYPTVAQIGQQPQAQRTPSQQIVQIPNVQVHNATPMVRNMQLNMQIPTQVNSVQHQGMVAGQPSQVTISAKNMAVDGSMPKFESDNKDCVIGNLGSPVVAGPPARQFIPGFRTATQITGMNNNNKVMALQSQSCYSLYLMRYGLFTFTLFSLLYTKVLEIVQNCDDIQNDFNRCGYHVKSFSELLLSFLG